jgi:D-alanyl-D-alanine carboxypeptidase
MRAQLALALLLTTSIVTAGASPEPVEWASPEPVEAQDSTAPIAPSMAGDALAKALDGWIAPQAAAGSFAGVVLVAKDGRPQFEAAYGLADRQRQTRITSDLRFNLASIGKAFTKVGIGQLVQQGKLRFTDTVGALLPGYPNTDAHAATVEQLLNHTGGIADFFGRDFDATPKDRFRSNADYFAFVAPRPLTFPPGSRNQYCNGCYVVLGEIIARISGLPYERYVEEHVFKAAGMTTAGFVSYGDPATALPYTRQRGDGTTPESAIGLHGVRGSAAGGAFARAADLLAFDQAVRGERLLNSTLTDWFYGNIDEAGVVAALKEQSPAQGSALRGIGIAGGAPGANAMLEAGPTWTVVVVGNLDPPNAGRLATAIRRALR